MGLGNRECFFEGGVMLLGLKEEMAYRLPKSLSILIKATVSPFPKSLFREGY